VFAVPKTAAQHVAEYRKIYERADAAGRDLTRDESNRVAELVERAGEAKKLQDRIDEFGLDIGTAPSPNSHTGGPGDIFVRSEGYKAIRASDMRPQQWSSGPVELGFPIQAKGTLLESGAGGPGGGLTPPLYQPGVVS
jgi:hypothetical protein